LNKEEVENFVSLHKPTHVFHLAARVFGIEGHKNFPAKCLLENNQIDNNVFHSLFKHIPQWIYYSSSVAAYGYPYVEMPLKEQHWSLGRPHESEFGYAMSKRNALSYLELLANLYNVKYVYGLTTNLFGNGDKFLKGNGHVVVSLLEKAKLAKEQGVQLKVWGNGTASRDFLSIQSATRILMDLVNTDARVLNIGSGQEISILRIAEAVSEVFDLSEGFVFTGENEGITNRVCDITKLKKFSRTANELNSFEELKNLITYSAQNSN
jgi:GDP-L-fucose synthase